MEGCEVQGNNSLTATLSSDAHRCCENYGVSMIA